MTTFLPKTFSMNRLYFSPVNPLVVLIIVLYYLWFINVKEQNVKKELGIYDLGTDISLNLKEGEIDQAREEFAEIMHIIHHSESKFEKGDEHEAFELKGNFCKCFLKSSIKKI
ncbi:hypothetical protein TNCV_4925081 [Trichonephila clavipes]|nr:hypothetical protein TNCV_4925081 [Trichonephila clavipes]